MTTRRIQTHKDCLEGFARELKAHIDQDLRAWRSINPALAKNRAVAYVSVVGVLKRQADLHGIPLIDLGLVDYEVPLVDD